MSEKRLEVARQKGELLHVLNSFTCLSGFIKGDASGQDSKSDKSVPRTQQFHCELAVINDTLPWKIPALVENCHKTPFAF